MLKNALLSAARAVSAAVFGLVLAGVTGRSSLIAQDAPPIAGRWQLLVEGRDYVVELRTDGEKVAGKLISPRSGEYPFEGGSFSAGKLRIDVPRNGHSFRIEAELKDGRFEGKLLVDGTEAGKATLTREKGKSPIQGKWNVITRTAEGNEYPSTLVISESAGTLKGKASSQLGDFDLKSITFDGEKLVFEIVLPIEGNDVAFTVNAAKKDANTLVGKWKTRDADFTGEWTATREAPADEPKPAPELAKKLEGEWFGVASLPDGNKVGFRMELSPHGESLAGKIHLHEGQVIELAKVAIAGEKIEFTILQEKDGKVTPVKVEGTLKDDALRGRWTREGESGEWTARKPTRL